MGGMKNDAVHSTMTTFYISYSSRNTILRVAMQCVMETKHSWQFYKNRTCPKSKCTATATIERIWLCFKTFLRFSFFILAGIFKHIA
jgi:hypothetical protein